MTQRHSSIKISFIAVLLLAGATAYAQHGGGGGGGGGRGNTEALPSDSAASDGSYADQSFVQDTLKDNETQLEMSQLAQQKASSGDVKDFSQHMIQIHTQLNEQLKPIAKQMNIKDDQKLSGRQKKELAQLQQLSGADFETAYLQAMAKEQELSLKAFKNEEATRNPALQRVAKGDEPVLTQHYEILQTLVKAHTGTSKSK